MNARILFRNIMRERRRFAAGTAEHKWRSNAARKYVWLMRGIPTEQWKEMT